jgi:precorrin-3B C17-methyltransferase
MSPMAVDVLERCEVVIGYSGYIDQIKDITEGKEIISMDLGEEMLRAAKAVELASAGKFVAVVSSGDAGIYGMAAPVFQQLTSSDWDGQDPVVEVVPGVSALQSSASLLGSPLMQDFCAISLSDLMTPWEIIRKRLAAASQGDFVVVLYNPRSRKRQRHVEEAREILLTSRAEQTPVGLVRNAYRGDQKVSLTTLGELKDRFQDVDMFTTVVIGNSTTYVAGNKMITPRGYRDANPA